MISVAFVYGWSEGPWQSKKFRKLLEKQGYRISKDIYRVDVIIAHSSGCYLVPKEIQAKQIIYIGLPYWPKRSLFKSVLLNLKVGMQNHTRGTNFGWWLNKLSHNIWYIFTRPISSYHVMTKMKPENLPKPESMPTILIRNHEDTFCHPNIKELLPQTRNNEFVELPGDHEDCWLHPERYIELIDSNTLR